MKVADPIGSCHERVCVYRTIYYDITVLLELEAGI
jgi:hypothetical protein